jgi:hypothetical protein
VSLPSVVERSTVSVWPRERADTLVRRRASEEDRDIRCAARAREKI